MNDCMLPPKNSHPAVEWLMYRSYEHNRNLNPERSVESWEKLYLYAKDYEKIYQQRLENQQ